MLHAAFQCLVDFVEREGGHFHDDVYTLYLECGSEEEVQRRDAEWRTIRELYHWWLKRRSDYHDHPEDNGMFHRLIDIRNNLWT